MEMTRMLNLVTARRSLQFLFLLAGLFKVHGFVPQAKPRSSSFLLASTLQALESATVIIPSNGKPGSALEGLSFGDNNPFSFFGNKNPQKSLVIVMPQLGDFDSAEYAELLAAVKPDLDQAKFGRNVGVRLLLSASIKSSKDKVI